MFIEFGSKRIHYNVIITSIYSKYSTPFESRIYQVASCRATHLLSVSLLRQTLRMSTQTDQRTQRHADPEQQKTR